jgi:hypothetical protein
MNDVIMEEMEERFVDNPSVQTETNTNLENGKKNMNYFLKTYMFKENFGNLVAKPLFANFFPCK